MSKKQHNKTPLAIREILDGAIDRIREMQDLLGDASPQAAHEFYEARLEAERALRFAAGEMLAPIRTSEGQATFRQATDSSQGLIGLESGRPRREPNRPRL